MGDSVGCVVALGEGVIINLFWSEGRKCEGFCPERHDWLYLKFNLGLEETAPLFWVNIPRIQISAWGGIWVHNRGKTNSERHLEKTNERVGDPAESPI